MSTRWTSEEIDERGRVTLRVRAHRLPFVGKFYAVYVRRDHPYPEVFGRLLFARELHDALTLGMHLVGHSTRLAMRIQDGAFEMLRTFGPFFERKS